MDGKGISKTAHKSKKDYETTTSPPTSPQTAIPNETTAIEPASSTNGSLIISRNNQSRHSIEFPYQTDHSTLDEISIQLSPSSQLQSTTAPPPTMIIDSINAPNESQDPTTAEAKKETMETQKTNMVEESFQVSNAVIELDLIKKPVEKEQLPLSDIAIPQLDGPSDDNSEQAPVRMMTFSFFDEEGHEISYEMPVSEEEFKKSKENPSNATSSSAAAPSTPNTANSSRNIAPTESIIANNTTTTTTENPGKSKKSSSFCIDRLTLEELFDRSNSLVEMLFSILFATFIAWLAFRIHYTFLYSFTQSLFLWLAVGMAHFSLIKSPQPDSNSPIHQNNWSAYSRGFYIVYFGFMAFLFYFLAWIATLHSFAVYGIIFHPRQFFVFISQISIYFILCFPILFVMGWLPNCYTFATFVLEQIHIHLFGGTAVVNFVGALLQIWLDLLSVVILAAVGYYSTSVSTFGHDFWSSGLYGALLVSFSYLLSRAPSSILYYVEIVREIVALFVEDLPKKLKGKTKQDVEAQSMKKNVFLKWVSKSVADVNAKRRFFLDILFAIAMAIPVAALQIPDALRYLNPYLTWAAAPILFFNGILLYCIIPETFKRHPFKLFQEAWLEPGRPSKPSLPNKKKLTIGQRLKYYLDMDWKWYHYFSYSLKWSELMLYTLVILSNVTFAVERLQRKGIHPFLVMLCCSIAAVRALRGIFTDMSRAWFAYALAIVVFSIDSSKVFTETFLFDFLISYFVTLKLEEFILKAYFMIIYSTPYISWGSLEHIAIQPLSILFFAITLFQLFLSVILSAPMFPIIGSALWFMSYPRALKFWEKNYQTQRKDVTNTKLAQHLSAEESSSSEYESNNLNSIFYEHLVVALRRSLPTILKSGELGTVSAGDIYCIKKDKLFALIHFVEVGNGFCSFQVRGVEFKGTICQEREQEAVEEALDQDFPTLCENLVETCEDKCCSCWNDNLLSRFRMIGVKKAFQSLWYTWDVCNTRLLLDTYNVIENPADKNFVTNENRGFLIKLYVKCMIYYLVMREELDFWISNTSPFEPIINCATDNLVDCDVLFSDLFDEDYDSLVNGVSFSAFDVAFGDFTAAIVAHRQQQKQIQYNEQAVTKIKALCFKLSTVARRALALPDGSTSALHLRQFLVQVHRLFKGDFRVTSMKDEWIFSDMTLLHNVIVPALHMSLKLYQDQFVLAEMYEDASVLIQAVESDYKHLVITHEGDPEWRNHILDDKSELFTLRMIIDSSSQTRDLVYRILMLEKKSLEFGVIKLNKESVRGLWTAQIHELVFLGNETAERGSIQNMVQTLRNIINSSCDIPIGYPVFISPITTSYF